MRAHHSAPGPFGESEKSTGFLKQFMLRFEVVFCLVGFWFCFSYRVSCIQVWSQTYCVTKVDLEFMISLPLLLRAGITDASHQVQLDMVLGLRLRALCMGKQSPN